MLAHNHITETSQQFPGVATQETFSSYLPTLHQPAIAKPHTMLSSLFGNSSPRLFLSQSLNFALILSTAFMLWKGLSLASNSPSPIVVVLSGSMEPAFWRGDLLVLWNRDMGNWAGAGAVKTLQHGNEGDIDAEAAGPELEVGLQKKQQRGTGGGRVGEVVVYNVVGKSIPIVHRIVRRHATAGEKPKISLLTKGDNNPTDDVNLYARDQYYLDRETEVIGSVVGYVPFVGYITILLSEHPWLKTAMLGLMGLVVITQRE